MAYTWVCGVCLKAFKTTKGKHWHEKRFGHQAVRLDKESQAQVFGLTRQEVNASLEVYEVVRDRHPARTQRKEAQESSGKPW